MENTEVIDIQGLQALFEKQKADVKSQTEGLLSDWTNKIKASYSIDKSPEKPAEILKKDEKLEVAEMADPLAGISKMEVMGLPLGQAVVGGFVAVAATELVDGFMAKQSATIRGAAKLGAAIAIVKFGKKLLGDGTCKAIALLVTFDAVRDFIPIDVYAQKLTSKITGLTMTAGLAGNNSTMRAMSATQANDYYSRAERR